MGSLSGVTASCCQCCFFLSWCCRETTPQDTGMNTKWTSDTRNYVFENTNSHGRSTWMSYFRIIGLRTCQPSVDFSRRLVFFIALSWFPFGVTIRPYFSWFTTIFTPFFPILVFTSCFWLCTACSLLESCTSSSSVSEKQTEKWKGERNTQENVRYPEKENCHV